VQIQWQRALLRINFPKAPLSKLVCVDEVTLPGLPKGERAKQILAHVLQRIRAELATLREEMRQVGMSEQEKEWDDALRSVKFGGRKRDSREQLQASVTGIG